MVTSAFAMDTAAIAARSERRWYCAFVDGARRGPPERGDAHEALAVHQRDVDLLAHGDLAPERNHAQGGRVVAGLHAAARRQRAAGEPVAVADVPRQRGGIEPERPDELVRALLRRVGDVERADLRVGGLGHHAEGRHRPLRQRGADGERVGEVAEQALALGLAGERGGDVLELVALGAQLVVGGRELLLLVLELGGLISSSDCWLSSSSWLSCSASPIALNEPASWATSSWPRTGTRTARSPVARRSAAAATRRIGTATQRPT